MAVNQGLKLEIQGTVCFAVIVTWGALKELLCGPLLKSLLNLL